MNDILYNDDCFRNTAEIRHQKMFELEALSIFTATHNSFSLVECRLFIDREYVFFGASPMRLYGNNAIVAVKCPVEAYKMTLVETIASNKLTFWKKSVFLQCIEEHEINEKCHWYIELQGTLHITERQIAYLIIWLSETDHKIVKVTRDDQFWKNTNWCNFTKKYCYKS